MHIRWRNKAVYNVPWIYTENELQRQWTAVIILLFCSVKFSQVLFLFCFFAITFCGEIKLCQNGRGLILSRLRGVVKLDGLCSPLPSSLCSCILSAVRPAASGLSSRSALGLRKPTDSIRYDTRCYINVRSKANMSQLNLPHATDN